MPSVRHVITGGSGFLGRHLAQKLNAAGEEVLIVDVNAPQFDLRHGMTYINCDVTQPQNVENIGLTTKDIVYHLAARQFSGPVPKHDRDNWFNSTNVVGTKILIDSMKKSGAVHLVFFSTDMTYGIPQSIPVNSDHPQNPLGPYGKSKVAAENIIRSAGLDFGLQATIFRPRLISGAGRLGILTKLFALVHRSLPVPLIGNGSNRYQMISVSDCATAAVLAAEKGTPNLSLNLGSDSPPASKDLLRDLIKRASSKSILIPTPASMVKGVLKVLDNAGLTLMFPEQYLIADRDVILNTSGTEASLGWRPSQSDLEILAEAYDSYIASKP